MSKSVCVQCGEPAETICDECSKPICFGCQAEETTICTECALVADPGSAMLDSEE